MIKYGDEYTCNHGEPWGNCPSSCTPPDDDRNDSWAPIDLGPYLRGEVQQPQPTIGIARSDGLRLIYPGKEHSIIGEMEAGKTWFCAASVAAELSWGRHVVYVHFEETDAVDLIGRLRALGVPDTEMLKLLRFVTPERQVSTTALAKLLDPPPALVIFDGVNEAMSLHRWGIRDEDGAASFRHHLVKPCVRAGAATLSCDHVVKDREARGRNALGSIHKGNGITGSLILLENAEPFGRGIRGRSNVFVTKDRPGHLRQHGKPDTKTPGKTFIGALVVDDTRTTAPELELRFWAPARPIDDTDNLDPDTETDAVVLDAIRRLLAAGKDANVRTLRATAALGKDKLDDALTRLLLADVLTETRGPRGSRLFTVAIDQLPDSAS